MKSEATKPARQLATRLLDEAETMAHKDPAKAVATAVGVGILLNVLPTRFLVASATAVTLTMLRPALLTLGLIKAFELCSSQSNRNNSHE
jgi:hypothetical protein